MPRARLVLAASLAAALAAAGPALAKKGDKHGHHHEKDDDAAVVNVDVNLAFASRDREVVRTWIVEDRGRGSCPPGLAKKHNGCMPPGQAKKRYRVGHRCPKGVVVQPLTSVLAVRLGPPPAGYRYGIIDGDVVKLAIGTMLVVDAIDGLVD